MPQNSRILRPDPPSKIHFSEVFAVVHVEKVVEVSCPAKRVDDALIAQRETWQHLCFNFNGLFNSLSDVYILI